MQKKEETPMWFLFPPFLISVARGENENQLRPWNEDYIHCIIDNQVYYRDGVQIIG